MKRSTTRGRQQVLFDYLPGRVFDFADGVIAKVSEINGTTKSGSVSGRLVMHRIAELSRAWPPEFRPALSNALLSDISKFVFIQPDHVDVELFPRVFHCGSPSCGLVYDATPSDARLLTTCPRCHEGRMRQLRFIRVHRCGYMQPLLPPVCAKCGRSNQMCLDTRDSERLGSFRWICRHCGNQLQIFGGPCPACVEWKADSKLRNVSIELHRSSKSYIAHTTTLLNVPVGEIDTFLQTDGWEVLVVGKYLGVGPLAGKTLNEIAGVRKDEPAGATQRSNPDIDVLFDDTKSAEEIVEELRRRKSNASNKSSKTPEVEQALHANFGITSELIHVSGREILERILLDEKLMSTSVAASQSESVAKLGVSRARLIDDFPILLASYGYSRIEGQPHRRAKDGVLCRLNPFPPDRRNAGRFPIFIDETKADAIFFDLDPVRVFRWLERNGIATDIGKTGYEKSALLARVMRSIGDMSFELDDGTINQEGRLIFELCHTLAHISVRSAALLCGLERISISEYLLPRSLCFGIFCNHRFGATIGALTALYEQSLPEFVHGILNANRCVYDPVCGSEGGTCHACTQLAETSCRYFNLELSRAVLFGGSESSIGNLVVGFLDPTLQR